MSGTVLLLRTTDAQGCSHGGFQWPREIGAVVTAPDWSPDPECGRGLHGLLWGEGNVGLLSESSGALWWVVEADAASVVDLGDKVKVPQATVRHIGTRDEAVAWLVAQAPGHATCYARVMAGDEGTAMAGHGGTAMAGDWGTATAGYEGTATAGDWGMLAIRRWDGRRYRLVVGYVGENGIEAGVPYRLDADGRFVRAEAQR